MQLPIDSSWIVDFQRASGTSLILWEEILEKEKDEMINDFYWCFPLGKIVNLLLASGNSVSWTARTKRVCGDNDNVNLASVLKEKSLPKYEAPINDLCWRKLAKPRKKLTYLRGDCQIQYQTLAEWNIFQKEVEMLQQNKPPIWVH